MMMMMIKTLLAMKKTLMHLRPFQRQPLNRSWLTSSHHRLWAKIATHCDDDHDEDEDDEGLKEMIVMMTKIMIKAKVKQYVTIINYDDGKDQNCF